jgi:amino-acid N-acetyltransferase
MNIRPATVADVPPIASLINTFAQQGVMLFRSHADLYESLRDFIVAERAGQIVGVCGLEIVWADLAEIRSLVVAADAQKSGIGRQLITACVTEAQRLKIQHVFALTYVDALFHKLGFVTVEKSALPQKVWSACVQCPKRLGCDEIAVMKTLLPVSAVPEETAPTEQYEVPTPMRLNVLR